MTGHNEENVHGGVISTRTLPALPDIHALRRLLKSLATLDALLEPEWQYRYYSFNSAWADGEEMGSMRNGSGDHWFTLFLSGGAGIVGLAHEAPMFRHQNPWPGLFVGLPLEMHALRTEPAFDTNNCTFCVWRLAGDTEWHRGQVDFAPGDDPDGSEELLRLLDGVPESYAAFATDYFELDVPLEAVAAVYAHEPMTTGLLAALNPNLSLNDVEPDLAGIGYPRRAG